MSKAVKRAFKYRFYPTEEQARGLLQAFLEAGHAPLPEFTEPPSGIGSSAGCRTRKPQRC